MTLLTKEDFLTLFPNHIIVAGRFKANKVSDKGDQRVCSLEGAERLNTLDGGKYDIFFTPNGDYANVGVKQNGSGRTKAASLNGKGNIYAIIGDIDFKEGTKREEPREFFPEFTPTIINKTKHGYHMYWLLKNPVDATDYVKRREAIEDKLVGLMGIDKKARDLARILRAPGFAYRSDNKIDDIQIKTIRYNPDAVKTFDEYENLVNTLYEQSCGDVVIQESLKKNYKKVKGMSGNLEKVFEAISNVDVRDILEALYPRFSVQDSGTIYEDGKPTHGYKWNKRMNYVNNFSTDSREDRPAGGPFSVAYMYYNRRLEDTLGFFRDKYDIKVTSVLNGAASTKDITFEKKVITDVYINEYTVDKNGNKILVKSYYGGRGSIENDGETTVKALSEGEEEINVSEEKKNDKIIERKEIKTPIISIGNLLQGIEVDPIKKEIRWYKDGNVDVLIDAFLQPIGRINEGPSGETYIIRIVKKNGYEATRTMPKCGTIGKFKEFLMTYGLSFPNKGDTYLQYVYNYVFSVVDEYYYTDKLGYQKIGDEMIIVNKTGIYVDEEKKLYVKIDDNDEHSDIELGDPNESLADYVEQLIKGYDGIVSYVVFLAMLLGINSYYIRNSEEYLQMPLVFVFGMAQSGKTFLLKHVFKSFGINRSIAAGSTAFVYTKNARHYIPINMTEFRNGAHTQLASVGGVVRGLFDGSAIEKGRSDQSIVKYESKAQYIFDGQAMFSDDALQTRMIIVMTKDKFKGDVNCLRSLPNIYTAATKIFKDENDFKLYVDNVYKKKTWIEKMVGLDRASERIVTNYAYLLALSEKLGFQEYDHFVIDAMKIQDGLCSEDDIARTYQKIFNLQKKKDFDYQLYKGGMLIHILENDLPRKEDQDDLKSFIQSINSTFLGNASELGTFSLYVDFDYVFKKKTLHSPFFGMISMMSGGVGFEPRDEEEYNTLKSLKLFVEKNDPHNPILSSFNFELGQAKTIVTATSEDVIQEVL